MFRLTLFEMKKIGKSNFSRILMLALLLFFIGYYVFIYINTIRVEDEIQVLKNDIQLTEQQLAELYKALETADDAEAAELNGNIDFYEEWAEKKQTNLALYEEENWEAVLQQEIDETEPVAGNMRYNGQTHTYTHPTLFTLETYIEMSKWMQEKEITPIFPVDRHLHYMTLYDREVLSSSPADAEMIMDSIRDYSNKYSPSSIHYLYRLFELMFGFFGVVFFLFLFGDIVTREGLGGNGPIHLLRTQPIRRDKILTSKYLAAILFSLMTIVGTIAFSIIVGGIFDRIGDWEYPVLIYGEERTFTFMGMGSFLIKASSMFMLILLFCLSILFLLSIMTKRVLITIGVTLGILLTGIYMSEELVTSNIAHYIPFQYFSVFDVITNEYALNMDNFKFTYMNGMVSLSVSSLIILLITYVFSIVQFRNSN